MKEAESTYAAALALYQQLTSDLSTGSDVRQEWARTHTNLGRLLANADYSGMLRALAPLKEPVDRFFDDVMVMVEDARLRANRLALLAQLRALMNRIADLSLLAAA